MILLNIPEEEIIMKNSKLFVSCVALSLLLVGCNKPAESSKAANKSSAPASSQPASSKASSSAAPSSVKPAVPTPDATQALVTQELTEAEGGTGATITWDAQDANKEADGFNDAGKFSSTGSYVKFTFNATKKMKARLFVTVENRSTNVWNRETQEGHQSIWYNWHDGDDWKYNVQVNTVDIDQSKMGTWKIGEQDIPMKELVYADFLEEGAASNATLEAPWFEFDVLAGRNTIRIERNLGYSVNMKSFKVVGTYVPDNSRYTA